LPLDISTTPSQNPAHGLQIRIVATSRDRGQLSGTVQREVEVAAVLGQKCLGERQVGVLSAFCFMVEVPTGAS
jgi:hypothetical protein